VIYSFMTTSPTKVDGAMRSTSIGSGSPSLMPSGVALTTKSWPARSAEPRLTRRSGGEFEGGATIRSSPAEMHRTIQARPLSRALGLAHLRRGRLRDQPFPVRRHEAAILSTRHSPQNASAWSRGRRPLRTAAAHPPAETPASRGCGLAIHRDVVIVSRKRGERSDLRPTRPRFPVHCYRSSEEGRQALDAELVERDIAVGRVPCGTR
jgi:hypothetical protein